MKKVLLLILVLMIISLAACQQQAKEPAMEKKTDVMEKKDGAMQKAPEAPKVETTGDAAVDAVGNDLNNVDSVDKDLDPDQLSDLDSGLADVQNI
ncbi:MAG: hypothetical protein Q8R04_03085 [Nanoarchaeota archaeon]|nr:hypothetical protein [Nanoarchaeota archaeon]